MTGMAADKAPMASANIGKRADLCMLRNARGCRLWVDESIGNGVRIDKM